MKRFLAALALALLLAAPAIAQQSVTPCVPTANANGFTTCNPVTATAPFPVQLQSGTASAGAITNIPAAAALADGATVPTTSKIGSVNELYNGTTVDLQRSAAGTTGIPAVNTEGTKATYDASASAAFAGATINDVCALPGSASKTIRVLRVEFYMFATAASVTTINVSKRSAANTGTAGTAMAGLPSDSANAAASAAPLRWADSSSEVPGAAVGNVLSTAFLIGSASVNAQPVVVEFTKSNDQALVLRGVAQQVAINLAGLSTPAGSSFGCRFRWTEE